MAITEFVVKRTKASLSSIADGVLEFDASLTETYVDEAEVTSHPVEGGSETSDHIRKLPTRIEINGIITNTPLVFLASELAKSPVSKDYKKSADRVSAGYGYLRKLMTDGTIVDIVTSLREAKNMALTAMSILRDAANGNVLNCSLSFREILIAGTLTTDLPLPDDVANKLKENQGKQETTDSSPQQEESSNSTLSNLAGGWGA